MSECMDFESKVTLGKQWMESIMAGIDPALIFHRYHLYATKNDLENEQIDILTLGLSEYLIDNMADSVAGSYDKYGDLFAKSYTPLIEAVTRLCVASNHPDAIANIIGTKEVIGQALIKAGERMLSSE